MKYLKMGTFTSVGQQANNSLKTPRRQDNIDIPWTEWLFDIGCLVLRRFLNSKTVIILIMYLKIA